MALVDNHVIDIDARGQSAARRRVSRREYDGS